MDYGTEVKTITPSQEFVDQFKNAVLLYETYKQQDKQTSVERLAYRAVNEVGLLDIGQPHFMLAYKVMSYYESAADEDHQLYILVEAWRMYSES